MRLQPLLLALTLAAALPAAPSLFDQAESALADGDFQRARSLASQAANSGDPSALLLKADALLAVGDREAAAAALEAAAAKLDGAAARLARSRALALQAVPTPGPKTKARKAAPSPQATATPLPTAEPTPLATAAPTAQPTVQPTAQPTIQPTPQPTAAATPDSAAEQLEAERKALELERAQLQQERERLALEKERAAIAAERRQLKESAASEGDSLPQGGLTLLWDTRFPGFTTEFAEIYGMPIDVGLGLRWKGAVVEAGVHFVDVAQRVTVTPSCPTCYNDTLQTYAVTAPWMNLGYELEPWKAAPGQIRPYLPLGLRFTMNIIEIQGKAYHAPTLSAATGLGLRWRILHHWGLEMSGRWHLHVLGESFDSDDGSQLKSFGGGVIQPNQDGPEFRLGSNFYFW